MLTLNTLHPDETGYGIRWSPAPVAVVWHEHDGTRRAAVPAAHSLGKMQYLLRKLRYILLQRGCGESCKYSHGLQKATLICYWNYEPARRWTMRRSVLSSQYSHHCREIAWSLTFQDNNVKFKLKIISKQYSICLPLYTQFYNMIPSLISLAHRYTGQLPTIKYLTPSQLFTQTQRPAFFQGFPP